MERLKKYFFLFRDAAFEFMDDNAIKYSASLSYYTLFSLAPLLLVFLSVVGYVYGDKALQGELYGQIEWMVGHEAALTMQEMVQKAKTSGRTGLAGIVGTITLLIGATGIFAEIQDSINRIWSLRPMPQNGIWRYIQTRILSFSMILSIGFLFLVSLILNTVLDAFSSRLELFFSGATVYLFYAVNLLLVWAIVTVLLAIIYNVLPDGKVAWKDAFIGAGITSVLFMIGRWAIGFYIGQSDVASMYGAAGSVVIILLWVNYSSMILFYGAELTKVYALQHGRGIKPERYTVIVDENLIDVSPRRGGVILEKKLEESIARRQSDDDTPTS